MALENSMRSPHSTWDPRRHHYEDLRHLSGRHIRRGGSGDGYKPGTQQIPKLGWTSINLNKTNN